MTIAAAEKRGREAFHRGVNCAPALDGNFGTLACRSEGKTSDLLGAWLRGWSVENVAAPVEPAQLELPFDERGLA